MKRPIAYTGIVTETNALISTRDCAGERVCTKIYLFSLAQHRVHG